MTLTRPPPPVPYLGTLQRDILETLQPARMRCRAIADALGIPPSNVHNCLSSLLRRKLVARCRGDMRRGYVHWRLTKEGRALAVASERDAL